MCGMYQLDSMVQFPVDNNAFWVGPWEEQQHYLEDIGHYLCSSWVWKTLSELGNAYSTKFENHLAAVHALHSPSL